MRSESREASPPGIIEYLADGSWTKRLHAGEAAQSGIRAALLAEAGFTGPATVLEGHHGFYRAFAPSKAPDFQPLLDGLGSRWVTETIAFKPYACGTMTQPYIDCAIELARSGVRADEIETLVCEVGEGTVHRLWEPLAAKQSPPNGYSAKFSTPYCIAVGFLDGKAGFEQFTDERVADPAVRALAGKVSYAVDPANPYPANFTGHIRATLKNGQVREIRRRPYAWRRARAAHRRRDRRQIPRQRALRRLGEVPRGAPDIRAGHGLCRAARWISPWRAHEKTCHSRPSAARGREPIRRASARPLCHSRPSVARGREPIRRASARQNSSTATPPFRWARRPMTPIFGNAHERS